MNRIRCTGFWFAALTLSSGLLTLACVEEGEPSEASPIEATECTGVNVGDAQTTGAPTFTPVQGDPSSVGSVAPSWTLEDVQPLSCSHGKVYGLEAFRGRPTLVVLLWSGCGFCQNQASKLQEMQYELAAEGMDVEMLIINMVNERNPIEELTNRCSFPIFQDVEDVDAWGLHGGKKDDFYFYDTDGVLRRFMSVGGEDNIVLSEPEGYATVKGALVDLINGTTPPERIETAVDEPGVDNESEDEARNVDEEQAEAITEDETDDTQSD